MTGYLARIQAAHDAGVFPAGEVTNVDVEHGVNCDHDRHRSHPCVCHPRITAVVGDELIVIGSHGHILERSKRS